MFSATAEIPWALAATKNHHMQQSYSIEQHIHNFAVWTAARAVQRSFTTTSIIKYAIEQTSLRSFSESNISINGNEYDSHHTKWAEQLITAFEMKNITLCSYGRAAKIISIYLKTSILLCNRANCATSAAIHPPIDGILLKNISNLPGLNDLKNIRWTKLDKQNYWLLVDRLKLHFGSFDWKLEEYWTPELD
jgi:hypothetical protein